MTTTTTQDPQAAMKAMAHAMKTVRTAVFAITAVTMVASYNHQVHVFAKNGAGWGSWILPAPLDLLVLALMKIAQLQCIPARSRTAARWLLLVPASASAYINFSGDGTLFLKAAYAGLILAIVIGDLALSLITLDPAVAAAIEAAAAAAAAQAAEQAAADKLAAKRSAAAKQGAATRAAKKATTPRTRKATAAARTAAAPRTVAAADQAAAGMVAGLWVPSTTEIQGILSHA